MTSDGAPDVPSGPGTGHEQFLMHSGDQRLRPAHYPAGAEAVFLAVRDVVCDTRPPNCGGMRPAAFQF
jgi:hypothetical protein